MIRKILLVFSILMALTGCEYKDLIPEYKFSTSVPSDLISGIYYHLDEETDSATSVLTLFKDGSYSLAGSGSDEYSLFPAESGRYSIDVTSYSVTSASGKVVFSASTPVVGNGANEEVSAKFIWSADAQRGPLGLVIEFSSSAVVEYVFNGRVSS